MQNARDNLADIMVPCKMHGTISQTLWFHAKCMRQSCGHYGFMQNAWDNLADNSIPCKMHGIILWKWWGLLFLPKSIWVYK